MDARRGESGGHPPLRVHEDDDVPLASRTAPEGGLVHFAAQVGGALRRTRSKTGSGSLERRGGAPATDSTHSGGESSDGGSGTYSDAGYTRSADETEYHERDPHRKFHPRSGGPLLQAPRSHSRLHRSNPSRSSLRSSGGSGALNDTLGFSCSFKLPSNSQLCRIFAVMSVFVLMLNVATCGFFLCRDASFPVGARGMSAATHADLQQLYERSDLAVTQANMAKRDRGAGEHGAGTATDPLAGTTPEGHPAPLMIPRVIHQTYKSSAVPDGVRPLMASWTARNPGWVMRFYDDATCRQFVRAEFPEYYDAYLALPKDVERSDFFRYLVVLHTGGVYADIDTECRRPLDEFLRTTDTLVVGWEGEFATDEMAYSRHFVRRRQVLNWVFAGAPGHPALREICDHIARSVHRVFTNNTNRDTLERTGPGAFTDVVMRQFWKHSRANDAIATGLTPWGTEEDAARADEETRGDLALGTKTPTPPDAWNVRVLPKVSFGTHPSGEDGVSQGDPDVLVAHHFLGSWKSRKGWSGARKSASELVTTFYHAVSGDLPAYRARISRADKWYAMPEVNERAAYPTSTTWEPPFDILTHLLGSEASSPSLAAAGASLAAHGRWQAGRWDAKQPTSAEALVGSLSAHRRSAALLDVGAGAGYFTLAAAARGRRVVSYEWAPAERGLLRAGVAHNGFGDVVDVRATRVGGRGEAHCAALVATEEARVEEEARRAAEEGTAPPAPPRTLAETKDALRRAAETRATRASETSKATDAIETIETIETIDAAEKEIEGDASTGSADSTTPTTNRASTRSRRFGANDRRTRDASSTNPSRGWFRRDGEGSNVGNRGDDSDSTFADSFVPWSADEPAFECALATELGVVSLDEVVDAGDDVAAMRVASTGWEIHVLRGASRLLATRPPPIILLEMTPRGLRAPSVGADRQRDARETLEWLFSLGYADVAHSGEACEERWRNITRYVDSRGGLGLEFATGTGKPTWCHSARSNLPVLVARASAHAPESVLLHHVSSAERLAREREERIAAISEAAAAREAVEEVDANERKMRAGDGGDGEKRR